MKEAIKAEDAVQVQLKKAKSVNLHRYRTNGGMFKI